MFRITTLTAFFIALITAIWQPTSIASEASIIDAINNGTITLDTKVAIPRTRAEASPVPGSFVAPTDLLYAITASEERNITDKAYPLMNAKWPFNVVFVCWENPSNADIRERALVEKAVAEQWQAHSALRFQGWQKCAPATMGIRILVEDTGPYVQYLGKYLDGIKNGMVLNFAFTNWSPTCQENRDQCIYEIAVHEFGHAIGFAHEQNRPDTPGECAIRKQGPDGNNVALTPYDRDSVMNYCNDYAGKGQLSAFDIKAVAYIYGAAR